MVRTTIIHLSHSLLKYETLERIDVTPQTVLCSCCHKKIPLTHTPTTKTISLHYCPHHHVLKVSLLPLNNSIAVPMVHKLQ